MIAEKRREMARLAKETATTTLRAIGVCECPPIPWWSRRTERHSGGCKARARLDADCRLYLEVARQLAEHPEDEEIYANFKRVMDVYDDALTDWGQFHPGRLHTR